VHTATLDEFVQSRQYTAYRNLMRWRRLWLMSLVGKALGLRLVMRRDNVVNCLANIHGTTKWNPRGPDRPSSPAVAFFDDVYPTTECAAGFLYGLNAQDGYVLVRQRAAIASWENRWANMVPVGCGRANMLRNAARDKRRRHDGSGDAGDTGFVNKVAVGRYRPPVGKADLIKTFGITSHVATDIRPRKVLEPINIGEPPTTIEAVGTDVPISTIADTDAEFEVERRAAAIEAAAAAVATARAAHQEDALSTSSSDDNSDSTE
jgi:hypothetical protein